MTSVLYGEPHRLVQRPRGVPGRPGPWTRRAFLDGPGASGLTAEQTKILRQIEKTLKCYIVESADAKKVREDAVRLENEMNAARNKLDLKYVEADGTVVDATPTVLRTKIRSAADESVRESCWRATRTVGPFLLDNGFPKIIAERNRFARTLGFVDFYDMKVTQAEGFSKRTCFEMLDGLEAATRPLLEEALAKLEAEKGADARKPWNLAYALSGELTRELDPYFPFENAPLVWGRSFAKMGIAYRGTTMRLDLCDRKGKYPNGFCHWPVAPHLGSDGEWHASRANFTSLATPDEVGSGNTALTTLMHEGGHAAHFANIVQGSPVFAQERAPFSVSLAETQSMFLDSLCGDASWLARYARDREGKAVPWDLLERSIREKHPYEVFQLRGMIAVPYFEKALYELPEEELTGEKIAEMADEIERKIQGGLATRPLLSVPHITSDESSCYYHGYVFAEMAVHQTRAHFLAKYDGAIVDNPAIGPELLENYWLQGSGEPGFLKMVENLTGKPLGHDAWVAAMAKDTEAVVADEKKEYRNAIDEAEKEAVREKEEGAAKIDLGMRAVFVHGDEVVADSEKEDGYEAACAKFKAWVNENWPKTAAALRDAPKRERAERDARRVHPLSTRTYEERNRRDPSHKRAGAPRAERAPTRPASSPPPRAAHRRRPSSSWQKIRRRRASARPAHFTRRDARLRPRRSLRHLRASPAARRARAAAGRRASARSGAGRRSSPKRRRMRRTGRMTGRGRRIPGSTSRA